MEPKLNVKSAECDLCERNVPIIEVNGRVSLCESCLEFLLAVLSEEE